MFGKAELFQAHKSFTVSANTVEVKLFSSSTVSKREEMGVGRAPVLSPQATAISGYVTVAYDGECWLGCVVGLMRLSMHHCQVPTSLHPPLCTLSRRIYWM